MIATQERKRKRLKQKQRKEKEKKDNLKQMMTPRNGQFLGESAEINPQIPKLS